MSKSQSRFSVPCLANHGCVQRPDDETGEGSVEWKQHQAPKSSSKSNLSISTTRCSRWSKWSYKKIYEEEVYSLVCWPSKEWTG